MTLTAAIAAMFSAFQWRAALQSLFGKGHKGLLCCSEALRGLQVTAKQGDWHERRSKGDQSRSQSLS